MLIRKNSTIKSLSDLRGKKSCHTGYGRNVGYKIPVTKLRAHGIIEISTDQYLPSLERELKGLSDVFSQSCLVGRFSPNDEINRLYSKFGLLSSHSFSCAECQPVLHLFVLQSVGMRICVLCAKILRNVIILINFPAMKVQFVAWLKMVAMLHSPKSFMCGNFSV